MNSELKRVGLLGGTFDPIHNGHLGLAGETMQLFNLQKVLFIPVSRSPHKLHYRPTSSEHRVAMLALALQDEPRMQVSRVEEERQGPSFTADTVAVLQKQLPGGRFFLIMGADAFLDLHCWYRFDQLLRMTSLIVGSRPGLSPDDLDRQVNRFPGPYLYDPDERCWRGPGQSIYYLDGIRVDCSSSRIRRDLAAGRPVSGVSVPVLDYIYQHNLYRELHPS